MAPMIERLNARGKIVEVIAMAEALDRLAGQTRLDRNRCHLAFMAGIVLSDSREPVGRYRARLAKPKKTPGRFVAGRSKETLGEHVAGEGKPFAPVLEFDPVTTQGA